jgi:2-oxoisovalerate dehydrogenase E1 component alpha subunit
MTSPIRAFSDAPIRFVDEQGRLATGVRLEHDQSTLTGMYRDMVRTRMLCERLKLLVRQGKSHFCMEASGQEAAQVGAAHAIRAGEDWIFPYARDLGLLLKAGVPKAEIIAQNMGRMLDPNKARQMPNHPGSSRHRIASLCSAIGAGTPVAAGTAFGQRLRGERRMTLLSSGEGWTSEGDWYAGMNQAAVARANLVHLVQNNHYAITEGFEQQSLTPTVHVKAHAFGIPGYLVDGQDVLAVHAVVREAAERARTGDGPSIVEAQTYRYGAHSTADDDSKYRSREEVTLWRKRDPLERLRLLLERESIWTSALEDSLRNDVKHELDAAVRCAEASGEPDPATLFDDVYVSLTPHLERQRHDMLERVRP